MKPALRRHLIPAVPEAVALLFGVPFMMYFISQAAEFSPEANRYMLLIGVPVALLAAAGSQIANRRRLALVMPFLKGVNAAPDQRALRRAIDFPIRCALHMFANFLVAVPVVLMLVHTITPFRHIFGIIYYALVTGLVVASLIFLIEEYLLRDTVAQSAIMLTDSGQAVVGSTIRLGISQRLVGLFIVVMMLSVSFGLLMGRLNQLTAIAFIGLISTLAIAFLSAWNITSAVQSFVELLNSITSGDGGLSRRLPVLANNELGDLSREYNVFIGQISKLVEDITKVAVDLAASSQQLAASSQEMNASAEEISSTIQHISRGASTQSERLTQVAKEVADLSSAIKQIDSLGRMTTVSSQKSIEASTNGTQKTIEIIGKMAEIYQSSTWATQQVQGLQQKSKEIGKVINLISNIAQQTDFLALNAAIEAARAGEAGKGFSVVADEIRSLAVEAGNSAQQVTSLIRDIEREITRTVEGITQSQKIIETSRSAVDQTEQSLKVINSTVAIAGTMVKQMAEASRRQSESAGHVVSLASEVSTISIETASSTEQVAAAVEEQTASMEELSALSQTLSQTAEGLSALVRGFRSDREG